MCEQLSYKFRLLFLDGGAKINRLIMNESNRVYLSRISLAYSIFHPLFMIISRIFSFIFRIMHGSENSACIKLCAILLIVVSTSSDALDVYTNHFHVHTKVPGKENAHKIARRNGFINRGPVRVFQILFFTSFFFFFFFFTNSALSIVKDKID